MTQILTKASCEAAATALGLTDTAAYEHSSENYTFGCLHAMHLGSDWLGWNPNEDNDVPCGTNNISCICSSKILQFLKCKLIKF